MATIKKDKYDINIIAAELEKIKTVKDGKASFSAFLSEDYITVLQTSLIFEDDIPEVEKRSLVVNGVFECAKKQVISLRGLLKYINIAEQNFRRKAFEEYDALTSISLKYLPVITNIRLNENVITFHRNTPTKYSLEEIKDRLFITANKPVPSAYTRVVISCKGRTYSEAINSAFESFDYLRGIWNFLINRLTSRRLGGERNPVNQILLGPIHTLHKKDGKLATTNFWYESFFDGKTKIYDIEKNYGYIKKNENYIRNKIKKIKYGNDLKKAFIRYSNALDYQDHNYSLLNLWSVLEFLTATLNDRYDTTIARTIFLYSDRDLAKQILEHLRDVRNKIVHGTERDERASYLVFQLKGFVEELLLFHIRNKLNFNSINEASQFLDLSYNKETIKNKIRLLKNAIKFREH